MSQHSHSHNHGIQISNKTMNRVFTWTIVLNLLFVCVEARIGLKINSSGLLSDASHNLSDVFSLVLAMIAFRLTLLHPTSKYTYGYKRSSIIASLTNAIILLIAVVFIIKESITNIITPQHIDGGVIAWIAGVGIVVNGVTAYALYRCNSNDLNIRGAFLHMMADTLVSAGVLLSGLIIKYTDITIIDPIIGIIIAVVILISTWKLLTQSIRLALDGVPENISVAEIENSIANVDGVVNVHHIHIWALSTTETALTAHIVVKTISSERVVQIKTTIKNRLKQKGIAHATLEFETLGETCDNQTTNV